MGIENIKTFNQLVPYLRDELDWPIEEGDFTIDDLTYEWDPSKDVGLKSDDVARIREIRQLRPLETNQPWGIFFINLDDKKIPVSVLKRILGGLTVKKRQSSNDGDKKAWELHDILFISSYGASGERELSFLHFAEENGGKNKVVLKELGWDQSDTQRKIEYVSGTLKKFLTWPSDGSETDAWRAQWASAFTITHGQVISTAKELTKRLAQLATNIRNSANDILRHENKDGPLTKIYGNFKETIFHNLTPDDFADMYAQTICYGLLAASIARRSGALIADDATMMAEVVTHPFLKDLMETFLAVGGRKSKIDFNELGINEVVEALAASDMDAVLRDFGNRNPNEDPTLHFYEYFLKDYDSIKREQRGVYYTPLPVVRFIVRSVHEILQKEFGLGDGLADTATWAEIVAKHSNLNIPEGVLPSAHFVQILDPATGTGTFLVEVIEQIEQHLKNKWHKIGKNNAEILRLWNEYVPAHLLPRLNGFELMMAPYVIAHIKLGMKLHETGYRPKEKSPRVRVYLTNTLEEPHLSNLRRKGEQLSAFSTMGSLDEEASGAAEIKARAPITVVIGNPPYSKHNENRNPTVRNRKPTFIGTLINDYYAINGQPLNEINSKNIKQDENKFIRYAEHRIDTAGAGILGYISASGYLYGTTMRGMRWHLMQTFNNIELVDLHGSVERDKEPPNGEDENVFAIRQGVVIALMRKFQKTLNNISLVDVWGDKQSKNNWLFNNSSFSIKFEKLNVGANNYLFTHATYEGLDEYNDSFEACDSIFPQSNTGYKTHRDHFALSFSAEEMEKRFNDFRNTSVSDHIIRDKYGLADTRDWRLKEARHLFSNNQEYLTYFTLSLYRPFDYRFCYLNEAFMDWPRTDINSHLTKPNIALITSRQTQDLFGCLVTNVPTGHKSVAAFDINYLFPLYLYPINQLDTEIRPNLDIGFAGRIASSIGLIYDSGIKVKQTALPLSELQPETPAQTLMVLPDPNMGRGNLIKTLGPRDIFDYIYAVLHSPIYRARYADFLKSDFPRIPLPSNKDMFLELVALGKKLVALHILDGKESKLLANPETRFIGKAAPHVERGYPQYENGKVKINANCHFEDITPDVWNFYIGGYQVCEKWLKDRAATGGRDPKPGHVLTDTDILHYRRVTIALRETIRLTVEIDAVIHSYGGWPKAFITS